jgi:prevent-host-death family protein
MVARIITVTELKTRLGSLISELKQQGMPIYITQHGKPMAVFASYEEYEALLQRIEDLEDLLAMKESLQAPSSEAMELGDYERQRKTGIRHQTEK